MVSIKVMYATSWCGDCKRSKRFLDGKNTPYKVIDIDEDEEGRRITMKLNDGKAKVPTIVFDDDSILVEPSNKELAEKLGIEWKHNETKFC
ncbi:MAG: NrdH-redoxin [Candidatus Heimdallarchaeota archaeon]|nr:NrdH-redoxin [Candidatus Heimdallarchaeota archaeon]MCK4770585.1 NrdH-redoxin [Candidatus Heimdallarchaeota archaeon]